MSGAGTRRAPRQTEAGPPVLLPEGIRRLCCALIDGADQDLTLARGARSWGTNTPHAAFELAWIQSARLRPGSFVWACQALGLDPGYVRRGLLAKHAPGRTTMPQATRTAAGRRHERGRTRVVRGGG